MSRPFNFSGGFLDQHHASTARGRGGFRGRARGSRASEPSPPPDAFSPPLDLEGLYMTGRGRERPNGRARGHQDNQGRGARRGRAGGPSQPNRAIIRGGPPPSGRGAPKRNYGKDITNDVQDDDLLEVDFNDLAQIFASHDPVPSRGGFKTQGHPRGGGQGGGLQYSPVPPMSTFNARGRSNIPRGLQPQGRGGQTQRGGLDLLRGRGRGNNRGSRGRGIGSFRSPNNDIDPDDLALRILTISADGTNPLLRPIDFVKSRTVLFQDHEEIFMPEVADSDTLDISGAPPTADRVEALFHQGSTIKPLAPMVSNNGTGISDPPGSIKLLGSKPYLGKTEKAGLATSLPGSDVEDDDDIVLYTPIARKSMVPEATNKAFVKLSLGSTALLMPQASTSASNVSVSEEIPPLAPQPDIALPASATTDSAETPTTPQHENAASAAARKRKRLLPKSTQQHHDGRTIAKGGRSRATNLNRRPLIRNSDVEWSTASDEDSQEHLTSANSEAGAANGDMDVDPDVDSAAYNAFVAKLHDPVTMNQVTAGDIDDQEQMANEDDDADAWEDVSESEPERRAPRSRSKARITEPSDDEDDESEVDENEDHLRIAKFQWDDEDDDHDSVMRAETLQMLLQENEDILMGGRRTRKERKKLMKMIGDKGLVADDPFIQGVKSGKSKKHQPPNHIPADLHQQWERDRQKKAENKRKRAEARRQALEMEAATPRMKRGKKLKIRLADSTDDDATGPDPYDIEKQIRSFVKDMSKTSLALPPMDKESRKHVHQLATSFKLKSVSKGKGDGRATTLTKTTFTGVVKEGRLAAQLRQWERVKEGEGKGKAGKRVHREGEEVGRHAAKIDDSNVGFQLLQAMGWTDGDRIGVAGGLEAPLKAVFKSSKLGLGAL